MALHPPLVPSTSTDPSAVNQASPPNANATVPPQSPVESHNSTPLSSSQLIAQAALANPNSAVPSASSSKDKLAAAIEAHLQSPGADPLQVSVVER